MRVHPPSEALLGENALPLACTSASSPRWDYSRNDEIPVVKYSMNNAGGIIWDHNSVACYISIAAWWEDEAGVCRAGMNSQKTAMLSPLCYFCQ